MSKRPTLLDRIANNVSHATGGCWEWNLARNRSGYGLVHACGKMMRAHRLAYEVFIGEIPDGMNVIHHCGNHACVNPCHLFLKEGKGDLANRLRDGVLTNSRNGCWEWLKMKDEDGYGHIKVDNKRKLVHRVSYEVFVGIIPTGMYVCHKCDNPSCCRPDHLFVGSQLDNMKDCVSKNRQSVRGGEASSGAKLTESQVLQIRKHVVAGRNQSEVAAEYGITRTAVSRIVNRKTWKHVD